MLYFAYGSNLSSKRVLARTPSARPVSIATLANHELRFHKQSVDGSGKCDAFETGVQSSEVIGIVYEIAEFEKAVLDKFEGLGKGYTEKIVQLTNSAGDSLQAMTYCGIMLAQGLRPYQWYKHHVLTGAIEHGLPGIYIDKIRQIDALMDPDRARHDREMSIYNDQ